MNISFVNRYRYFIYRGGCDMRKGYDGLCGLVINEFKMSPLSGDVFVFLSKPRNKIKILHWQGDGFVIYSKRWEKDWKNYLFAIANEAIGKRQKKLFVRRLPRRSTERSNVKFTLRNLQAQGHRTF